VSDQYQLTPVADQPDEQQSKKKQGSKKQELNACCTAHIDAKSPDEAKKATWKLAQDLLDNVKSQRVQSPSGKSVIKSSKNGKSRQQDDEQQEEEVQETVSSKKVVKSSQQGKKKQQESEQQEDETQQGTKPSKKKVQQFRDGDEADFAAPNDQQLGERLLRQQGSR
jgi:hypothetical protein